MPKITFDRTLDNGTEVMVLATASVVTPYTARNLRVEVLSKDGSDIQYLSNDELDDIEEEAIEKLNDLKEIDF